MLCTLHILIVISGLLSGLTEQNIKFKFITGIRKSRTNGDYSWHHTVAQRHTFQEYRKLVEANVVIIVAKRLLNNNFNSLANYCNGNLLNVITEMSSTFVL